MKEYKLKIKQIYRIKELWIKQSINSIYFSYQRKFFNNEISYSSAYNIFFLYNFFL